MRRSQISYLLTIVAALLLLLGLIGVQRSGILTLDDALAASRQTLLARIQY